MLSLILRIFQSVGLIVNRLAQIQRDIADLKAGQAAQTLTLERMTSALEMLKSQNEQILDQLVPGPAVGFIFTAILDDGTINIGVNQMNLTDSQQATLSIQPVDKKGNPALVDGVPAWLSSNSEVVTVTPSADGLSAVAVAVGPLGTATVSVTADADLGAGVTEIAGSLDITITAGAATTVSISAGDPTEQ